MEKKEGFKRLTIEEMKKAREQKQFEEELEKLASHIDETTDKAMIELLQELGFDVPDEEVTQEEAKKIADELAKTGRSINITAQQEGNQYIVQLSVIQVAKTLTFDVN